MAKKIVMDAGHGFNTAGKRSPNDEREWTFNNAVVVSAIEHLKNNGFEVLRVDDPTGKTDVPLKVRTDKANVFGADAYISCHHNANTGVWGNWTGTETFTYIGNWANAEKLAGLVHNEIVKAYGLKNRGLKKENFHVLRETNAPAILIEGGYMDSTIDILKLRNNEVLKEAGKGIAKGVCAYFGVPFKELAKPTPKPQPTPTPKPVNDNATLYRVIVEGKQIGAFKDPLKAIQEQLNKHPKEIVIQKV